MDTSTGDIDFLHQPDYCTIASFITSSTEAACQGALSLVATEAASSGPSCT
jgi:hypothetical protein